MQVLNGQECQKQLEWRKCHQILILVCRALQLSNMHFSTASHAGRSVFVRGDLASAFRRLDHILSRNKVRAQAVQSERHEQKGAKRRRLSSERWRRRFAHEVRYDQSFYIDSPETLARYARRSNSFRASIGEAHEWFVPFAEVLVGESNEVGSSGASTFSVTLFCNPI